MAVQVAMDTPLAEALGNVVQPKLSEVGWSTGEADDSALGEYIILMLVNGKTQDQIAAELSEDLLSLPPEDSGAVDFARWLFEQVETLNNQINGVAQQPQQPAPQSQPSEGAGLSIKGSSAQDANGTISNADLPDLMDGIQDNAMWVMFGHKPVGNRALITAGRPTGPKSMRNNSRPGGARRMMGHMSKAMDRSSDSALHRVRPQQGTERINTHNRQPPKGPRGDMSRNPRMPQVGRPNNPLHNASPMVSGPLSQITPQQQMQLLAMYEEQARMMSQIFSPQQFGMGMGQPAINPAFGANPGQQPPGRSLFERVEGHPQKNGGQFHRKPFPNGNNPIVQEKLDINMANGYEGSNGDISSSMEVESSQAEPSPETTCRFNLKCTKQDCPYAHQSPAAPPGTPIDVSDICSFGAACKNKKCVGRHPSPAQKVGYQTEQDCKFFPNCTNPTCPFRHPNMPMCKNGADCSREGCKYTHIKINCKFNPCLNAVCPYKHAEGQKRGKYGDKVWTADSKEEHVSERKFIDDDMAEEELVVPGTVTTDEQRPPSQHSGAEVVT